MSEASLKFCWLITKKQISSFPFDNISSFILIIVKTHICMEVGEKINFFNFSRFSMYSTSIELESF